MAVMFHSSNRRGSAVAVSAEPICRVWAKASQAAANEAGGKPTLARPLLGCPT